MSRFGSFLAEVRMRRIVKLVSKYIHEHCVVTSCTGALVDNNSCATKEVRKTPKYSWPHSPPHVAAAPRPQVTLTTASRDFCFAARLSSFLTVQEDTT